MIFKKSIIIAMTAVALSLTLAAQEAQTKKPAWKDRQEYDLANAANTAKTPAAKLEALNKWKQQYPTSDFSAEREDAIMDAQKGLNQWRQAFDTAQAILKNRPDDFQALSMIIQAFPKLMPPSAADIDAAQMQVTYLMDNLDKVYGPSNKPQGVTDAQWSQAKEGMKPYIVPSLVGIIQARKDNKRAETDLTALLKKEPSYGQISYVLAGAMLANAQADKNPEEQKPALYQYARAAAYAGPNSLNAANRQQIQSFLTRAYTTFHGSAEGLDKLLAMAKDNPFPPAGFSIKSSAEVAQAKAEEEQKAAAANPQLALWKNIKMALTSDTGAAYWDMSMKDAALPGGANGVMKFKGKIVSMTPETRPKQIVLAVETPGMGDATLNLDAPLPGKMEPGEEISFSGVAKSYMASPYMVTFDVMKDDIEGWTGKNAPARRPAAGKGKNRRKK